MLKSIAGQFITVIAAAAVVAGLAIFLSPVVPEARAEPQVKAALYQTQGKGDRLAGLVKGTACSSHGWPHHEQRCQFDLRRPTTKARTVRVIALR